MRVYTLPPQANKNLLKVLYGFNDYGALISRLQMYLRSSRLEHINKRDEVVLLINKICLYNIFKYAEADSMAWFVTSLKNNTIGYEMNINPVMVADFFRPLMGLSVTEVDVFQVENLIVGELNSYLSTKYTENSAALNESFVGIFDMFNTYLPISQINIHRFELTPTLIPLAFCSDKHQRS